MRSKYVKYFPSGVSCIIVLLPCIAILGRYKLNCCNFSHLSRKFKTNENVSRYCDNHTVECENGVTSCRAATS
jgi:hypothetical protein